MTYETRITRIVVHKTQESIHGESATTIEIGDLGGGEFVTLTQNADGDSEYMITIDPDEWPTIRKAIDQMVKECKPVPVEIKSYEPWRASHD